MCVRLKGSRMKPGQVHAFLTSRGTGAGIWGFNDGAQYNVRSESIPSIWRKIEGNRGILYVDSFWEADKEFARKDGKDLAIGVLYNQNAEFAVITVPAKGIVLPHHKRMPLLLDDEALNSFLEKGLLSEMNLTLLQMVA